MDNVLLVVFARALKLGQVKTRLIPDYGSEGALALYCQLLERTLGLAADFDGEVCLMLDGEDPELEQRAAKEGWRCALQQGDSLGERMASALAAGLSTHAKVLLIGSDCPVLTPAYLESAAAALDGADVVFGPSEDGGYVLIGSAAPLWSPDRFQGVRLGSPHALKDSQSALLGHNQRLLTPLWDVDVKEDVVRAQEQGLLVAG